MELVYLWVEDYKNIQKQGFNFSPRFRCEYDEEKNELTINENKDYVSIFPDNINITAIVGENGSGKSSLLELISDIGYYENPYRKKNYPVLFSELVHIIVYHDRLLNKLYVNKKNIVLTVDNKTSILKDEIINESIQKIFIKPTPSHNQKEYLQLLDFLKNNNMNFPFDIPEIITFSVHDDFYNLLDSIKNESFDFHTYYTPFEENQEKRLKVFHILLLVAYLVNYKIDFNVQASENFEDTILELENIINEKMKLKIKNFIQTSLEDFSVITNHCVNIKQIPEDFFKLYIEIIKRKNGEELLDFKGKNVFNFDFYPKISDGQYQLTYIFNSIYSQINQDTILLCIDEGENYLHPNWQKKYINYLYQFLRDNYFSKQIHLIISSHSPFILSDLPKENIIFLEKGKQVYPFDDRKQTFGANIHTLLSHGFFMKDGLMGEFAKDKIQSIIKYHEDIEKKEILEADKIEYKTKKQKEFWQIQSIIGDDYLKQVIKNHLVEIEKIVLGNDEAKEEEIKRLEAQIEQLRN